MGAADVANRYFECIRARDIDGLIALYAPDAVFIAPGGQEVIGAPAIRQMQLGVFERGAPMPSPQALFLGESGVAVEIRSQLGDGTITRTVNVFTLDSDGRIARLSVYRQGG